MSYEGGRTAGNKSTIIKVSLRDAVNELKLSPDLQTRSVMRYHCNYGMNDHHLIYLVDDTIFDTYYSDEDGPMKDKNRVYRINFETNSAEFIVEWKDGLGVDIDDCIKGSFLYVPICSSTEFSKDRHFLVIYLDNEINSDNWTQYIRSYENVVNGDIDATRCTYANRWSELFYDDNGPGLTIHVYGGDLNCNYKSKIDHIRNSVCIAKFIQILEQYFCLYLCISLSDNYRSIFLFRSMLQIFVN